MADPGFRGDVQPFPSAEFELALDGGVKVFGHSPTLAKYCYNHKQHIASKAMQTSLMEVSPLNLALAENLSHYMKKKGLTQMALAKRCGIGQTTISLYLAPERRKPGKDAKPGSAKLTEVEMLASALEVEPWELVRPTSDAQRELWERFEAAYQALKPLPSTANQSAPGQDAETAKKAARGKKTEKA